MPLKYRLASVFTFLLCILSCIQADQSITEAASDLSPYGPGRIVGRLEDNQLAECSGMDLSRASSNIFWAINDGHRSPFLFAFAKNGQSLGRIWVKGAENRDWEGLDTFVWNGRPMILIADIGDNQRKYDMHTLYIVEEPLLRKDRFDSPATAHVVRRIVYSYPDARHDAEAVAVDIGREKVLILTKRDNPPILFEVPLAPPESDQIVVASKVASVSNIRPPEAKGLFSKYAYQPTALDISNDGLRAVVLTYTHAYLFTRNNHNSWAHVLAGKPARIELPNPMKLWELRQREAICFATDDQTLLVTSEGRGAGILRLDYDEKKAD